jgi:hypothetical protein
LARAWEVPLHRPHERGISWESNMNKFGNGQLTRWQDARSWAEGALARARAPQSRQGLLGIYLNDHLAGATGGMELAHRLAGSHHDPARRVTLQRLAADIAHDRRALLELMTALGLPVRHYKLSAAWTAEKAARLKLNGRLLGRSPLSNLEELEMLRLGVEGKAAGWRTLRALADTDSRLHRDTLDELMARAREQAGLLEELRVQAAAHLIEAEPGTS